MLIVMDVVLIWVEIVRILTNIILVFMILVVVVGETPFNIVLMVIVRGVVWIIQDVVVLANIPENVMFSWINWNLIFPIVIRKWNTVLFLPCGFLFWVFGLGWGRMIRFMWSFWCRFLYWMKIMSLFCRMINCLSIFRL